MYYLLYILSMEARKAEILDIDADESCYYIQIVSSFLLTLIIK